MMKRVISFKKLNEDAVIPTKGSEYSAGYDLYALVDKPVEIAPGETKFIGTGLATKLPAFTFGGIYARSGLACKQGLRPGNCVGVLDCDYRGEIMIALHNDSQETRTVFNKDRIAQLIVQPYTDASCVEVDELDETERGAGGFGHTGR